MNINGAIRAKNRQVTDDETPHRGSVQSTGSMAFSGQRWGLIAVEAMEATSWDDLWGFVCALGDSWIMLDIRTIRSWLMISANQTSGFRGFRKGQKSVFAAN